MLRELLPISLVLAFLYGCSPPMSETMPPKAKPTNMSLDRPNTLTIRSGTRNTVFSIEGEGEIWFRQDWKPGVDQVIVNLEADKVISGGTGYETSPSITLSWLDSPFDLDRLVGRSIHIPHSYDEDQQDHVSTYYNGEHLDFDDVRIKFVEKDGERLHLHVTGKVAEFDATGDGKVDIEINATVRFVDRNTPHVSQAPRSVEGVGKFVDAESCWECDARYDGHPVVVRLFAKDNFEQLASFARSIVAQKKISLAEMQSAIGAELELLEWKFDDFGVEPNFEIDKFYPQAFSISQADDDVDSVSLNVFLAHPDSGTDAWILRYVDRECQTLEWIPDRSP